LIEEAEKKRIAEEAEKKRLIEEAEKKRKAEEAAKKQLSEIKKKNDEEMEVKRLSEETVARKRLIDEEKVRLAEAEKKLLSDEEAERKKQERLRKIEERKREEAASKKKLVEEAEKEKIDLDQKKRERERIIEERKRHQQENEEKSRYQLTSKQQQQQPPQQPPQTIIINSFEENAKLNLQEKQNISEQLPVMNLSSNVTVTKQLTTSVDESKEEFEDFPIIFTFKSNIRKKKKPNLKKITNGTESPSVRSPMPSPAMLDSPVSGNNSENETDVTSSNLTESDKQLLKWVQMSLGNKWTIQKDFSKSFCNGMAIGGLIATFDPDLLSYELLNPSEPTSNFERIFEITDGLGIEHDNPISAFIAGDAEKDIKTILSQLRLLYEK